MRSTIFFIIGVLAGIAGVLVFRWLKPRFSRSNGEIHFRYRKAEADTNKKKAGKK